MLTFARATPRLAATSRKGRTRWRNRTIMQFAGGTASAVPLALPLAGSHAGSHTVIVRAVVERPARRSRPMPVFPHRASNGREPAPRNFAHRPAWCGDSAGPAARLSASRANAGLTRSISLSRASTSPRHSGLAATSTWTSNCVGCISPIICRVTPRPPVTVHRSRDTRPPRAPPAHCRLRRRISPDLCICLLGSSFSKRVGQRQEGRGSLGAPCPRASRAAPGCLVLQLVAASC